jgi:hypothetical protein
MDTVIKEFMKKNTQEKQVVEDKRDEHQIQHLLKPKGYARRKSKINNTQFRNEFSQVTENAINENTIPITKLSIEDENTVESLFVLSDEDEDRFNVVECSSEEEPIITNGKFFQTNSPRGYKSSKNRRANTFTDELSIIIAPKVPPKPSKLLRRSSVDSFSNIQNNTLMYFRQSFNNQTNSIAKKTSLNSLKSKDYQIPEDLDAFSISPTQSPEFKSIAQRFKELPPLPPIPVKESVKPEQEFQFQVTQSADDSFFNQTRISSVSVDVVPTHRVVVHQMKSNANSNMLDLPLPVPPKNSAKHYSIKPKIKSSPSSPTHSRKNSISESKSSTVSPRRKIDNINLGDNFIPFLNIVKYLMEKTETVKDLFTQQYEIHSNKLLNELYCENNSFVNEFDDYTPQNIAVLFTQYLKCMIKGSLKSFNNQKIVFFEELTAKMLVSKFSTFHDEVIRVAALQETVKHMNMMTKKLLFIILELLSKNINEKQSLDFITGIFYTCIFPVKEACKSLNLSEFTQIQIVMHSEIIKKGIFSLLILKYDKIFQ